MTINWDALSTIATFLAIVVAFITIFISQYLQNRAKQNDDKRQDKMEIFKQLMEGRNAYVAFFFDNSKRDDAHLNEINRNINLIPIVFNEKNAAQLSKNMTNYVMQLVI